MENYIKYKGKGEHSVNELEKIIEQREEELRLIRSGQVVLPQADVSGRNEQFVCLCPRNETDNCDRKVPRKECETCPHLRQTNCH